jgi:hypothetical protein
VCSRENRARFDCLCSLLDPIAGHGFRSASKPDLWSISQSGIEMRSQDCVTSKGGFGHFCRFLHSDQSNQCLRLHETPNLIAGLERSGSWPAQSDLTIKTGSSSEILYKCRRCRHYGFSTEVLLPSQGTINLLLPRGCPEFLSYSFLLPSWMVSSFKV